MILTVKEIYDYNREHSYKMLSAYTSSDQEVDFWGTYKDNYNYFDRLFMKTYKTFVAFNAEGNAVDEVSDDFRSDVYAWLMANDKRYSELYRIQVLSNDEEPISYNYDMVETYTGTSSSTEGARSDTHSETRNYGAESESITTSETLGAHTDTHNNSNSYGATSGDNVQGSAINSNEHKVSAYNSSTYIGKDSDNENQGQRTDTHSEAAHSDTLNLTDTFAKRENSGTEGRTKTAHSDTISGTQGKGAQTNSGTEGHTLTRKGNIGTQTGADIAMKHQELWTAFSFYKIIFDDIANEFLTIGR